MYVIDMHRPGIAAAVPQLGWFKTLSPALSLSSFILVHFCSGIMLPYFVGTCLRIDVSGNRAKGAFREYRQLPSECRPAKADDPLRRRRDISDLPAAQLTLSSALLVNLDISLSL